MTHYRWSQTELVASYPEAENFGALIGCLEKEVTKFGEVICDIRVNGELVADEEGATKDLKIDAIQLVEVTAQKPTDLLSDSLDSTLEYLDRLVVALEKNAFLFRGADLKKAYEFHRSCIEGTQWFVKMVTLFKGAYENAFQVPLVGWQENEDELEKVLRQVLDVFQAKNFVLMADVIEYDLLNNLQNWRERLREIRSNFNDTQNSSG